MAAEVLNIFSSWAIGELHHSLEVVLDMLDFLLLGILILIVIRLHIKNNIFFECIKIKVKILGLDLEIKSKEKKHPSHKD